jgi:hypothetical protein
MVHLAYVHITEGAGDLGNTQFLNRELSFFGGFEYRRHFAQRFLYIVESRVLV